MERWARYWRLAAVGCLGAAFLLGGWGSKRAPRDIWAAGSSSSVIEKVNVTFNSTYGEAGEILEPEIIVTGTGCSLGDFQYRTEYEKWKPGKKVRIEVTVAAEDGLYFPHSLTSSQCKVKGADFVSAKALGDNQLQVKADYRPVTVLETPQKVGWSSSTSRTAVWEKVDSAPGYSLTLYGNNKVVKRMTVNTNRANLSSYMNDMDKTYYYEVKAVPMTSDQKKYLKEGEAAASTDQEFDWEDFEEKGGSPSAEPVSWYGPGDDGGSFRGDNYILPDGRKATDIWKKSSGKWYYFGSDGNRFRGWLNQGGKWYYLDQNGAMCSGWINPEGDSWFYLSNDGDMRTGWIQPLPGDWYYLDQNGYMQRGWVLVDGKWYYMAQSGRMQTGWIEDNGKQYYLFSDGSMAVNTPVGGRTLGADGAAVD